jgi:peptidoglycan L-alanyl-D-glutamate endopeptidase CwlK
MDKQERLPAGFSPADQRTRNLALLVPEFRTKVEQLLANCQQLGVKMVAYTTRIGPAWEAELYCHSRKWAEVQVKAAEMKAAGAPKLAALLKPEFCKAAAWKSNALPGRSWHAWGEAVDCFVEGPHGTALWSGLGYEVYAKEAEKLGLTAGHRWRVKDSVHVQLRVAGGVTLPWPEIEALMQRDYTL